MSLNNLPSTKRSNQAKNTEQIKYSYKDSFKRENISILDDSVLIKNYNDSLKSPQSRICLLYTSPSPRDDVISRMPSSA